jgi:hypothetical protein
MHSTALLLFLACGEEEPPALPTAVDTTPETSSPELKIVAAGSSSEDPWAVLLAVSDADRVEAVQDQLEMRALERSAESTRIDGAVVRLEAALARSCSAQAEFDALLAVEQASLERDRELLVQVLGEHGPELRSELWEDRTGLVEALTRPYAETNKRNHRPVPSFMSDDEDVDEVRLLLALSLSSEGAKLDGEAAIADAAVVIAGSDPEDEASVEAVAQALAVIHQELVEGQTLRFQGLEDGCRGLSESRWLSLVGNGAVGKFLGVMGGEAGFIEPATAVVATKSSKGGKGGKGGMEGGGMQGGMQGGGMQGGGMQGGMEGGGMQGGGMQGGAQGGGMQGGGMQGGMEGGGMQGGGKQGGGMQGGGMQGGAQGGGMQGGAQGGGMQGGGMQGGGMEGGGPGAKSTGEGGPGARGGKAGKSSKSGGPGGEQAGGR